MKKLRYAPYNRRIYAFCIDLLILLGIFYFVDLGVTGIDTKSILFQIIHFSIISLLSVGILSLFETSSLSATPGKIVFGLRVVTLKGKKCSPFIIVVRNLMKVFTCIYLFLIPLHFDNINNLLILAIFFSVSTNAIWHDFMTVVGGERHNHMLVHDQIAKTEVVLK